MHFQRQIALTPPKSITMSSVDTRGNQDSRNDRQRYTFTNCKLCNRKHTTNPKYAQCSYCKKCHYGGEDECYSKHPEKRPPKRQDDGNGRDNSTPSGSTALVRGSAQITNLPNSINNVSITMASVAPYNASFSSIQAITSDTVLLDSGSSHHKFNDTK